MSLDNTIRSIAYSEASTLGVAMAQIAKRRNDLEAAMRAQSVVSMPVESMGAAEERALLKIEPAGTHRLDKQA